jgi:hypothetical protein
VGVNRALAPSFLASTMAQEALNVELTQGTVRKRPGWVSKMAFSEPILGAYDYMKVEPLGGVTIYQMVKAGTSLYATQNWDATVTAIDAGLSGTEYLSCATANNRFYYCDGLVFRVTDGVSRYNAQITRPAPADVATLALTGATGNLAGVYDYKYTFYSPTWGQESPASDASLTVTAGAADEKQVVVTMATAAPDARVTIKRVYRRKVSAQESVWKYVGEVAVGTATFTDNVRDLDASTLLIAPLSYSDSLPAFRYLAYQGESMFLGGSDLYPTRLYYTTPGQPWSVTGYLDVGSGTDTDPITGVVAFRGFIVVFKERSIWNLSGNDEASFYFQKQSAGRGCKSHHSIVEEGGLLHFLGEDGFYVYDGSTCEKVSGKTLQDPIQPDISARNYARDRYCQGVFDPDRQAMMWSYSSAGAVANDVVYVLYPEHSKRMQFPCWVPWTVADLTWLGCLTDLSTRQRSVYPCFYDGIVGEFSGSSDNGVPIACYWRTGELTAGSDSRWKKYGEFELSITPQDDAEGLIVCRCYLDGSTVSTAITTQTQADAVIRARIGHSASRIVLEFYASTDQPVEWSGFSLAYTIAGRS